MRADLVRRLAGDPKRHLVLVTATPHSGNEAAFRDLLGYLDPAFATLPDDLSGDGNRPVRGASPATSSSAAAADITNLCSRRTRRSPSAWRSDETYTLTKPSTRQFIDRVIAYAREVVRDPAVGNERRQRVRWWSVLALLRSISSSPAAAAATLRERSRTAEAATQRRGRRDRPPERCSTRMTRASRARTSPRAPTRRPPARRRSSPPQRRLRDLAKAADALAGKRRRQARQGHRDREGAPRGRVGADRLLPVHRHRRVRRRGAPQAALPTDVTVEAVTGTLAADDRKARVDASARAPTSASSSRRTACRRGSTSRTLSTRSSTTTCPGTRRATNSEKVASTATASVGRRSRSSRSTARTTRSTGSCCRSCCASTRQIRDSLGISVPVPGRLQRRARGDPRGHPPARRKRRAERRPAQLLGAGGHRPAAARASTASGSVSPSGEAPSRSLFAQHAFPLEEVVRARDAARAAVGDGIEVRRFAIDALRAHGATATERPDGAVDVDAREIARSVRDAAAIEADRFRVRFEPPAGEDPLVGRTHPLVDGLATHLIDTALDPLTASVARRAGVIRTSGVTTRTTALVVRLRFDLRTRTRRGERTSLAEEVRVLAFTGAPGRPDLAADRRGGSAPRPRRRPATSSLSRRTTRSSGSSRASTTLRPAIERVAAARAADLAAEHERVRDVARSARQDDRDAAAPGRRPRDLRLPACSARLTMELRRDPRSARRSAPRAACCPSTCSRRSRPSTGTSQGSPTPTSGSRPETASARRSPGAGTASSAPGHALEAVRVGATDAQRPADDTDPRALAPAALRGARLRPAHGRPRRRDRGHARTRSATPGSDRVPVHLVGFGVELDTRTKGVRGAAGAAPHALVQEYLNRSDDALWGIVSNGRTLAPPARQHLAHPAGVRRVRPRGDLRGRAVRRLRPPLDASATGRRFEGERARRLPPRALDEEGGRRRDPGARQAPRRRRAGDRDARRRLPRAPRERRPARGARARASSTARTTTASSSVSSTGSSSCSPPRTAATRTTGRELLLDPAAPDDGGRALPPLLLDGPAPLARRSPTRAPATPTSGSASAG